MAPFERSGANKAQEAYDALLRSAGQADEARAEVTNAERRRAYEHARLTELLPDLKEQTRLVTV